MRKWLMWISFISFAASSAALKIVADDYNNMLTLSSRYGPTICSFNILSGPVDPKHCYYEYMTFTAPVYPTHDFGHSPDPEQIFEQNQKYYDAITNISNDQNKMHIFGSICIVSVIAFLIGLVTSPEARKLTVEVVMTIRRVIFYERE